MLEDGTGSGTDPDLRMLIAHGCTLFPSGSPTKDSHSRIKTIMQLRKLTWELNKVKLKDESAGHGRHFRGISPMCAGGSQPLGTCAPKAAWDVTHNLLLGHGWLAVSHGFTYLSFSFWDDSPSGCKWQTIALDKLSCELGAFASNGVRIGHSRMNSRNQRDMMGYLGMQDPFMPVLALEYHVVLLHCCTSQKRVHQCIVRVHHTYFLCPCNCKCHG